MWVISGYHLSLLMMFLGYSKVCHHDRLLVKLPFMKQQDLRPGRAAEKASRELARVQRAFGREAGVATGKEPAKAAFGDHARNGNALDEGARFAAEKKVAKAAPRERARLENAFNEVVRTEEEGSKGSLEETRQPLWCPRQGQGQGASGPNGGRYRGRPAWSCRCCRFCCCCRGRRRAGSKPVASSGGRSGTLRRDRQ